MTLKLKCIKIDTLEENVAFLPSACGPYRPEEFKGYSKIEVRGKGGKSILATLNIVENGSLLAPDVLGLSTTAFRHLGLKTGTEVKIFPAIPPASLDFVRSKIYGEELSAKAYNAIIKDISSYRYSKMEVSAFLVACASFMTVEEILHLTRAMAEAGTILDWGQAPIVDKHCVGGIPGNRTSMIVVPIVAAYGLTIPKTSSRAITSPAGTADTMEVLARVNLSMTDMKRVVKKNNGCLVWGGKVNLSPADDILIAVERPLGIDTPEQMVASIMSKKMAAGSTHLVIDIPVGPTAKVRTKREAMRLRKLFEHLAKKIGMVIEVVITDGTQPIGFGIGPALEARDVMAVLKGSPKAPRDLRERALLLAGTLLDFDPKLPGGQGYPTARRLLENGQAFEMMNAIIAAQGPARKTVALGSKCQKFPAPKSGKISALDCWRLNRIAKAAGAPVFKGAGVDLLKKVGDQVKKGETLFHIHSEMPTDFALAKQMAQENSGVEIK